MLKELLKDIDPDDVLLVHEGLLDVGAFLYHNQSDTKLKVFNNSAVGFLKSLEGALRELAADGS